jgi:flagellar hook-associated protein 1 FlgK
VASGALAGTSVDFAGINRNLNTLLQSQLWTETSGASYADLAAQYYQNLQPIYGTPGSSSSFDAIYGDFTNAVQALAANPSATTAQSAVIGAAQAVTQNLDAMTGSIQQLPTPCCSRSRRSTAGSRAIQSPTAPPPRSRISATRP